MPITWQRFLIKDNYIIKLCWIFFDCLNYLNFFLISALMNRKNGCVLFNFLLLEKKW